MRRFVFRSALAALALSALPMIGAAAQVELRVTVENLAPTNSIAFAPLRVGFNSGTFDSFDEGATATAPIISIAEGGSGSDWFPAFMAADPTALLGTVVPNPAGPLVPGATGVAEFTIDTDVNPFFTFAAMVVPSNDFFIGSDAPMAYRLFDAAGQLQIASISQTARQIWDAGSEVFDPAAAAFVGNNDLRSPQNSVVALNFGELSGFNGLTTATGYAFHSGLAADDEVYRIGFAVAAVPEPGSWALMAAGLLGVGAWRGGAGGCDHNVICA